MVPIRCIVLCVLSVLIQQAAAGCWGERMHSTSRRRCSLTAWRKEMIRLSTKRITRSKATARDQDSPHWHYKSPDSHLCKRPCKQGEPMTCHYTFKVEWYYAMSKACYDCPNTLEDCYRQDCIPVGGVSRTVMVVNRQLPGPSIEVCHGDTMIVDVENLMNDESTSIHWHGHHQSSSPYMDGVPFITQCPIAPNTMFSYTMHASNSGTHFWHAHTGVQRGDGVFGPLIVRIPDELNPLTSGNERLYDEDLSEHIMTVHDWTRVTDMEKFLQHFESSGDNKPDTILINGMGRYYNDSVKLTYTPLAIFTVKQGKKYRFRVINSGVHNCPFEMYIDRHPVIAIASDGHLFDQVKVDSLVSYAGERWDFVLHADQEVGNYWIRFTGLMDCDENFKKAHQVAILHYEGAPETEPKGSVGYRVHPTPKLQLNALNALFDQNGTISVPKLCATDKTKEEILVEGPVDKTIYLSYDFNKVDHPLYHKPGLYGFDQVKKDYQRYTPQFDHVTFKMPHSPLLTQIEDIDPDIFCAKENLTMCASNERFCECTYIIDIPLGAKTELILIDKGVTFDANHPFHLHGYAFRVVGMDRLGTSTNLEEVKRLDREGLLKRNLVDPPFKDTVTVPDGGYTILRFHAHNPGYWLMHCHIEFHLEVGMAVVFRVGTENDLPPVPNNFPKCGNFNP